MASGTTVDDASPATNEAIRRIDTTRARITDVTLAGRVLVDLDDLTVLHPGPPLQQAPSGPLLSGLAGALRVTRRDLSQAQARSMIQRGEVRLQGAHEHGAVLPAAGGLSRDMAVVVVESDDGHRAMCPLNEGSGPTLRFGNDADDTIAQLRWMAGVVMPALGRTLAGHELTEMMATSLRRGDEGHGRTVAGRDLLLLAAALSAAAAGAPPRWAETLAWAADNIHFFNSFTVAAARVLAMAAADTPGSRLVTAIASNGHELGVRAEGLSPTWFTTRSPKPTRRTWPGAVIGEPHPLIGDSFAMEVVGLGAAALDAAPASCEYFGLRNRDVAQVVARSAVLSRATSDRWLVPQRGYGGTPLALDLDLIREAGHGPAVDHAVLDATAGRGQLGAAVTYLPLEPFIDCARQEFP